MKGVPPGRRRIIAAAADQARHAGADHRADGGDVAGRYRR
jgi:hypothetical protein